MKNPRWVVKSVKANKDYTLELSFEDGTHKIYDAHHLLEIPIYESLKNLGFFLTAKAEYGTVVWNDDVDIAPEHLYEASKPL